ncbi:hypothetical protein E2C01_054245 [Portunus trituberculatus]|uniref:Secreted protein n=1 Tax=Portunus trituberculatus TaxID=210409 RepID=A0A5B7GRF5_PORTR|nr:hypothetical protein [Portunus trituberculatus]
MYFFTYLFLVLWELSPCVCQRLKKSTPLVCKSMCCFSIRVAIFTPHFSMTLRKTQKRSITWGRRAGVPVPSTIGRFPHLGSGAMLSRGLTMGENVHKHS